MVSSRGLSCNVFLHSLVIESVSLFPCSLDTFFGALKAAALGVLCSFLLVLKQIPYL
jgi:hypothetical protein